MMKSRMRFAGGIFVLAALVAAGGGMGCGGAGGGGGRVMTKADVVDVTYYYLPG